MNAAALSVELSNQGLLYLYQGSLLQALDCFDRAIAADPESSPAHFNRACALSRLKRYKEEAASYDEARRFGLDIADLHHNQGLAYYNLNDFDAALRSFALALDLPSDHKLQALIHNSRGLVLHDLGRYRDAKQSYVNALTHDPSLTVAKFNLGLACLATSEWRVGWEGYEHRWDIPSMANSSTPLARPSTGLARWNGEPVPPTATLLVFSEQGYGDTLQFCRYLIEAKKIFAKVTLVCPPALHEFLEAGLGPAIECLTEAPSDEAPWQWHIPLLSLSRAFLRAVGKCLFPTQYSYLVAEPQRVEYWNGRFASETHNRRRIGLVWAGSQHHHKDAKRSLSPHLLRPLLEGICATWVSLQKHASPTKHNPTIPHQLVPWLLDWTNELNNFADTAALISSLDLVISVDTACAHLAGALGKPVWLLNRYESEWRWRHGEVESHWYPSMRIFSQPSPDDWQSVIAVVGNALNEPTLAH